MDTTVVVGGGIGGLACAVALSRAGRPVTVLERRAEVADAGTGLAMWPNAVRALDTLGLGDEVRRVGVWQTGYVFRRSDGRRLGGARGRVVIISRGALTKLLLGALPDGLVRTGVAVSDVDDIDAPVVVGADGVNSLVRRRCFGVRSAPVYSGYTAWRGLLDGAYEPQGEILGRGAKFGTTRVEGGRTNWYAPVWAPPGTPFDDLYRHFDGWCDPVPEILARTDRDNILRHDLHHIDPPLPSYVNGRVVLVGDSAHAMTPDLGQGACQALIDGATLGDCLVRHEAEEALRRYDSIRRRPSQRVARTARLLGQLTMRPGLARPRNVLLRATSLGNRK
jgi:2-polyprenyl-6-methoxyphenol hydroxylase-like FAD-dependent oxidoreductase